MSQPDNSVTPQAWRVAGNRRATFISEIASPLPDQGAVDRLQITERECALSRVFEQGVPPPEIKNQNQRLSLSSLQPQVLFRLLLVDAALHSQFHVLPHRQRPANDFDSGRIVRHKESSISTSRQNHRHSQVAVHPFDRTSNHDGLNAPNKKVPRFVLAVNKNIKRLVGNRQLPHFSRAAIPPRKESAR
jgi:hypothetical protein